MIALSIQPLDRMTIERFVAQSLGQWRSMRSGHSLAFQQFEDVLSEINIESINKNHRDIQGLLESSNVAHANNSNVVAPFKMQWSAESDWEPDDPSQVSSGSCLIIPLQKDDSSGTMLRSVGYAESEPAESTYHFLDDGTFLLTTHYELSLIHI